MDTKKKLKDKNDRREEVPKTIFWPPSDPASLSIFHHPYFIHISYSFKNNSDDQISILYEVIFLNILQTFSQFLLFCSPISWWKHCLIRLLTFPINNRNMFLQTKYRLNENETHIHQNAQTKLNIMKYFNWLDCCGELEIENIFRQCAASIHCNVC